MILRWWPLLILIALTAASGFLLRQLEVGRPSGVNNERHDPDLYMDNFVTISMGEDGKLNNQLGADRMLHFPDDDTTELTKPSMIFYSEGRSPWYVRSSEGWSSANQESVWLKGDVRIWRINDNGKIDIEVLTRDLYVMPDRRFAETDKPTTINTLTGVTHATGMRVYIDEQRIELLSNVSGRYETKTSR